MPRLACRFALAAVLLAACKQPLGARCQVNEDCESGVCSIAEPRTCREGTDEGPIDAAFPPDARVDGGPIPDGSLPILFDAGTDDADAAFEEEPDAPFDEEADAAFEDVDASM